MQQPHRTPPRILGLVAALSAFGGASSIAAAQAVPPPPPAGAPLSAGAPPPVGAPSRPTSPLRGPGDRPGPVPIDGIVVDARPYHARIRTNDGRYVELRMHAGTIIDPRGTTLATGMHVAVRGVLGQNGVVATDEIDVRPLSPPPHPPRP